MSTNITPADFPEYWREHYEERAAIREYEGNQPREQAEAEALRETIVLMKAAEGRTAPGDAATFASTHAPTPTATMRTSGEPCPECGNSLVPESGC